MNTQYDREVDQLERDLDTGAITQADYWKAMRELQADYRAAAQDAAQDAYNAELERW